MFANNKKEIWGVLGGMGPLASAEFLNTIYEKNMGVKEQESPIVYLISDPTIPDRTECFLNGTQEMLLEHFSSAIEKLAALGVDRIVVCCVTIHPLVPRLPAYLQEKIVSLVDLVFESVLQDGKKHLLLCTQGSRQMRIFEDHALWKEAASRIVLPDEADQAAIHSMICEIKIHQQNTCHFDFIDGLMQRYGVTSYIAGCTEMHILARQQARARQCQENEFCIDPLISVASMMSQPSADTRALQSRNQFLAAARR